MKTSRILYQLSFIEQLFQIMLSIFPEVKTKSGRVSPILKCMKNSTSKGRRKPKRAVTYNLKAQQPEYTYFMLLFPYPTSTSYTIPFTGWEVNKLYSLVTKPLNLLELLSTPKCDAPLVKGSQVSTFWGPTHVGFCPALQLKKKVKIKMNTDRFSFIQNYWRGMT